MAVERAPGDTSLVDVLDRVLDKGIVIDTWVRLSLVGIDLSTVEACVVVASTDTYLRYSDPSAAPSLHRARTLGSHAASEFALQESGDDDDDGGGGSSGAPATVRIAIEPRRYPSVIPHRTR